MRTIVKGKNYEVPERVRRYAERKLRRLERLLDDRSDAVVELSVERHHSITDSHVVDVTLTIDGRPVRGRAAAPTHVEGIDEVVDKLERQTVDLREKPRTRARPGGVSAAGPLPGAEAGSESGASGNGRRRTKPASPQGPRSSSRAADEPEEGASPIVKVKRFAIEPMFEEDALARIQELGHAFFVFVNAENERIAILYRRRAGDFGLIEPVIGGDYTTGGSPSRRSSRGAGAGARR